MWSLRNAIRPYAWGSRTALATLLGRPSPSAQPEAELWLGAHPSAPSTVQLSTAAQMSTAVQLSTAETSGVPLTEAISADPTGLLGSATAAEFGARLPYLLKVLAADQPLSIQAHPDEAQARAGFDAEEKAGVARDSPNRNYVDAHHKPELLVAVGDFEALCGFRAPEESADELSSLGIPALDPVLKALTDGRGLTDGPPLTDGSAGGRLRVAMETLMSWPESERAGLVKTVAERHELAAALADRYPGDLGVVVALLLNHVRLRTDEAVFMPAGNLHAYLRGLGVEIMAASDNVLRGGLTPKHVDVPELMRVLRFEVLPDPVVRPEQLGDGLLTWRTPIREFVLVKGSPGAGRPVVFPGAGPRILVSLRGTATVSTGEVTVQIGPGGSVFVPATAAPVTAVGDAALFQASPSTS